MAKQILISWEICNYKTLSILLDIQESDFMTVFYICIHRLVLDFIGLGENIVLCFHSSFDFSLLWIGTYFKYWYLKCYWLQDTKEYDSELDKVEACKLCYS